jgi:hypothetical protein
MAKKRKTPTPKPLVKSNSQRVIQSNYNIARKILQHFDLDPNLIDSFSKKQREVLTGLQLEPPSLKPDKENTIPRQYTNVFRAEINEYMRTHYWGNPENKLSYMEVATSGMAFMLLIRTMMETDVCRGTPQEELLKQIYDRMMVENDFTNIFATCFGEVFAFTELFLRKYTKINFRYYGFRYDFFSTDGLKPRMQVRFTADNCQAKMFTHNGVHRPAFRLFNPPNGLFKSYNVTIQKNLIVPDANENHYFNIYVQSHALHRFKERIDVCSAADKNMIIHSALTMYLSVASSEKQKFLVCNILDEDCNWIPAGYFPFFLQGRDLIITSFLPMTAETTPTGEKLRKILPLSKEELIYLGMDKISFYLEVDFEQIPFLKQVLIEAGMWELVGAIRNEVTMEDETGEVISPINEKRTLFVKHFFDKLEESLVSEAEITEEDVMEETSFPTDVVVCRNSPEPAADCSPS